MKGKRGKFITFEGGDGSGKSTQLRLASSWLAENGYNIFLTREPGGTRIGEMIRTLLLDPENTDMTEMTEMLLYAAARAQLAREEIEPALAAGRIVLCDRWADSSLVYQGAARGLGEAVRVVNSIAAGELFSPDATILLDLDPEEAMERAVNREYPFNLDGIDEKLQAGLSADRELQSTFSPEVTNEGKGADRIEALGIIYQKKVRDAYLKLAEYEPARFHIVDASGSPEEVHARVRFEISRFLSGVAE